MKKKTCIIITRNKYKQLYAFVQELYGAAALRFKAMRQSIHSADCFGRTVWAKIDIRKYLNLSH